jgi:hypothetical protein
MSACGKPWAWCRRGGTQVLREIMSDDLVGEALRRVLAVRRPTAGLFVHPELGVAHYIVYYNVECRHFSPDYQIYS